MNWEYNLRANLAFNKGWNCWIKWYVGKYKGCLRNKRKDSTEKSWIWFNFHSIESCSCLFLWWLTFIVTVVNETWRERNEKVRGVGNCSKSRNLGDEMDWNQDLNENVQKYENFWVVGKGEKLGTWIPTQTLFEFEIFFQEMKNSEIATKSPDIGILKIYKMFTWRNWWELVLRFGLLIIYTFKSSCCQVLY